MNSKILLLYVDDSHYKWDNLYEKYLYDIEENNNLVIYSRDKSSGIEKVVAVFRKWDYMLIE